MIQSWIGKRKLTFYMTPSEQVGSAEAERHPQSTNAAHLLKGCHSFKAALMAYKYWIKLYHEVLDDPKMGTMSDRMWRRTIELFLLAGDYGEGGILPPMRDMAYRLRISDEILESDLVELAKEGIVAQIEGQWIIEKFQERQSPETASKRAKRFREGRSVPSSTTSHETWRTKIYKDLPTKPGIYLLSCKKTDAVYIGASKNIRGRIRSHLTEMKTMSSHVLYNDFHEHGHDSIEVKILELAESEKGLARLEVKWQQKYDQSDKEKGKRHWLWEKQNENQTNRSTDKIRIDTDIDKDKIIIKRIIVDFHDFGMKKAKSKALIEEHNPYYLLEKIREFRYQNKHIKSVDVGWLVRSIEENWPPPKGYTPDQDNPHVRQQLIDSWKDVAE